MGYFCRLHVAFPPLPCPRPPVRQASRRPGGGSLSQVARGPLGAPIRAVGEADGTVSVLDRRASSDLCTVTVLALALKECGTAAGWPLRRRGCGPRPRGREVPCPPPWPSQLPLALPGPQSGRFPGGFPRLRDGGQLGAPPLAGHGTHSALHWEAATTQDPGQGGRPEVSSQTASRPSHGL